MNSNFFVNNTFLQKNLMIFLFILAAFSISLIEKVESCRHSNIYDISASSKNSADYAHFSDYYFDPSDSIFTSLAHDIEKNTLSNRKYSCLLRFPDDVYADLVHFSLCYYPPQKHSRTQILRI